VLLRDHRLPLRVSAGAHLSKSELCVRSSCLPNQKIEREIDSPKRSLLRFLLSFFRPAVKLFSFLFILNEFVRLPANRAGCRVFRP